MRLGVLGGTFDPPHLGHLILAQCAFAQLKLDAVKFIPAGDPWRKVSYEVTPAQHRLEMARLAVAGDARFGVDDCEVRRQGPTYTSETLTELRSALGASAQLYFLVGEDAVEDMRYWRDPQAIFAAARLAVAPRLDAPVPVPPTGGGLEPLVLPDHDRLDMPYIGINATDLRARIRRGESVKYLVPETVDAYIREHGLYR